MPIYEYECGSCGHRFELRRSMTDKDEGIACPKCGVGSLRRVFSAFAKGSSGSETASLGTACTPRRGFG
jgi:putative FmdB family regulatory protein